MSGLSRSGISITGPLPLSQVGWREQSVLKSENSSKRAGRNLTRRESLRPLSTSWPRITNVTNATCFTCSLLLTFQLCPPHAGLTRRFGWSRGASEHHQEDYGCEESKAKAHIMPYEPGACLGISFLPCQHVRPRRRLADRLIAEMCRGIWSCCECEKTHGARFGTIPGRRMT